MEFIKAFEEIDTDDSGEISGADLEAYMRAKNYKPAFVEKWLRIFDSNNTGKITLEEFCNTLGLVPGKKQQETIERRNTLKQLEMAADIEKVRLKHEEAERQKKLEAQKRKSLDKDRLTEEGEGYHGNRDNDLEEEIVLTSVEQVSSGQDGGLFYDYDNQSGDISMSMNEDEMNKENSANKGNKDNENINSRDNDANNKNRDNKGKELNNENKNNKENESNRKGTENNNKDNLGKDNDENKGNRNNRNGDGGKDDENNSKDKLGKDNDRNRGNMMDRNGEGDKDNKNNNKDKYGNEANNKNKDNKDKGNNLDNENNDKDKYGNEANNKYKDNKDKGNNLDKNSRDSDINIKGRDKNNEGKDSKDNDLNKGDKVNIKGRDKDNEGKDSKDNDLNKGDNVNIKGRDKDNEGKDSKDNDLNKGDKVGGNDLKGKGNEKDGSLKTSDKNRGAGEANRGDKSDSGALGAGAGDGIQARSRSLNKNRVGNDSVDANAQGFNPHDDVLNMSYKRGIANRGQQGLDDTNKMSTVNYALGKTSSFSEDDVEIIAEDPDITNYLRNFAVKLSLDASRNYDNPLLMAKYVKMVLDDNFNQHWQVVTGRDSYGSLVTHEEGMFIHIRARNWGILMWQINQQ